ncbi:hypothetical protein WR25_08739 [Diploscapter pachys]|uniref:DDE domain-containing protein n=2 Tax=cellular organisms TaxID=131567 RepID=A0A2A2K512_9BILA|nr:hypothetical protein WR25_08739 [Diploscapter pachys]
MCHEAIAPASDFGIGCVRRGCGTTVRPILIEREIDICHETVRLWWNRFAPLFAGYIRRQRVSRMRGFRRWRWHLDEMYVKLNGEMVHLWRAVGHEGEVLESYVTNTRGKPTILALGAGTFLHLATQRDRT